MQGVLVDERVRVGGDAKQQFHDSRAYGRVINGTEIELSPTEAAHLLARGDIDAIVQPDSTTTLGLRGFLQRTGITLQFGVYKDIRDRGFYLSPAAVAWPGVDVSTADSDIDFVVFPRGSGPDDGSIAYRIRVASERDSLQLRRLSDTVTAVVDEDGEITYFEAVTGLPETESKDTAAHTGSSSDLSLSATPLTAALQSDRVICDPGDGQLYQKYFFGQRLFGRNANEGPLQLSLLEGLYLATRGAITVDPADIRDRGRSIEAADEMFTRRYAVYHYLRSHDIVPKSGYKFGADFRIYPDFSDVSSLEHSAALIRVHSPETTLSPRELSLDVRLAGGVRKRMSFALTEVNGDIDWLTVARLTP